MEEITTFDLDGLDEVEEREEFFRNLIEELKKEEKEKQSKSEE